MEPGALQIEARDDRLAVRLPGERMAWFPLNDEGRAILAKERRVLRLLETYCAFQAPRVLYESDDGWDIRSLVAGVVDPSAVAKRVQSDPDFAFSSGTTQA